MASATHLRVSVLVRWAALTSPPRPPIFLWRLACAFFLFSLFFSGVFLNWSWWVV